jgi:eukaryotic translation initiation factor 2C
MVLGADVSHPAPSHKGVKPSIVAVTASVDPSASRYLVQIRVQERENNEEVIHDMKNIVKALLLGFNKETNRKPAALVMYRDGVSEGQFLTVLAKELTAIRAACQELPGDYQPPISYLVVQKRHHTRFFPESSGQPQYRNGNALAGTVVDQGINHPTEGDFYLLSHEGIQGTSRPCHYQVLWDDNNLLADQLEVLSYYLCHLYTRCNRSVSYPAPTYYSHLAADRARKHHDQLLLERKRSEEAKRIIEDAETQLMYFV